MDELKLINEYFANDDPPAVITNIKIFNEHYYTVKGNDSDGEFETNVFVSNGTVIILPE